jgi:hypothetical protein
MVVARQQTRHLKIGAIMSDKPVNESPVDADGSSATYDADSGQIVLEQKPGEQPVTIAGGALGPKPETAAESDTGAGTTE